MRCPKLLSKTSCLLRALQVHLLRLLLAFARAIQAICSLCGDAFLDALIPATMLAVWNLYEKIGAGENAMALNDPSQVVAYHWGPCCVATSSAIDPSAGRAVLHGNWQWSLMNQKGWIEHC